jgi:hypothetical protein
MSNEHDEINLESDVTPKGATGTRGATEPFIKQTVSMWMEGKSPEEIAEALNKPLHAIYRILKNIETALANEIKKDRYPLRGTLSFYNDPTSPVGEDDWNALI